MHWISKTQPPVIFAHRGASKYAPENTKTAFELALQQGAEAIELDTMLSGDGIPVVIHDRRVDRTTNGIGRVDQMSIHELGNLDAGSKFSSDFKGERIPLLEEVFNNLKNRTIINVELKNIHNKSDGLPEIVVKLAKKIGVMDQILFSSFSLMNLVKINCMIPSAHVALICPRDLSRYFKRSRILLTVSPDYIHMHFKDISKPFISKQHRLKRKVNVWTVNQTKDLIELLKYKIDGIITDDPKTAITLKRQQKASVL